MSRRGIIVPPDCSTRQALGIVAKTPRIWLRFVAFLARFAVARTRFVIACWSHGYSVRAVRQMAREHAATCD